MQRVGHEVSRQKRNRTSGALELRCGLLEHLFRLGRTSSSIGLLCSTETEVRIGKHLTIRRVRALYCASRCLQHRIASAGRELLSKCVRNPKMPPAVREVVALRCFGPATEDLRFAPDASILRESCGKRARESRVTFERRVLLCQLPTEIGARCKNSAVLAGPVCPPTPAVDFQIALPRQASLLPRAEAFDRQRPIE